MFGFLSEYYRCLYLLQEETVKTVFYKENTRNPVSKNKTKKKPFPIGGKMYHVDQSKNYMATWHLVVKKREEVFGVTAVF